MPHKLLLADDSVTIQRVIELTFADEDVQVLAVGDGRQAIARVQSDRPDIVLADVGMPERDGYEVAAFIKGDPELAHIPVLLLTGAFEPIDEARAQAVGCDGVLVKPFEPQMVINRVKDLLAGRRPQGPWSGSPAAQTPVRQAAPVAAQAQGRDFDLRAAAPQQQPAASGSLEDYFDRLDAAFASLDAGGPPASSSGAASAPPEQFAATAPPSAAQGFTPIDDLAGWDPDLIGDPAKPVALDASPASTEPLRAIVPPPPAYAPPAAPTPPVSVPAAPAAFAPTPAPPSPTLAPPSPTPRRRPRPPRRRPSRSTVAVCRVAPVARRGVRRAPDRRTGTAGRAVEGAPRDVVRRRDRRHRPARHRADERPRGPRLRRRCRRAPGPRRDRKDQRCVGVLRGAEGCSRVLGCSKVLRVLPGGSEGAMWARRSGHL